MDIIFLTIAGSFYNAATKKNVSLRGMEQRGNLLLDFTKNRQEIATPACALARNDSG